MELIAIWLGIPLLVLLVTGPFAASICIAQVKRNNSRWLWIVSLGLGPILILEGIIAHTFGSFSRGTGCFVTLLTPFVATVTAPGISLSSQASARVLPPNSRQRRWFPVGSRLISLLPLSAPIASFAYGAACQALDRQAAEPIIAASHEYRAETGSHQGWIARANPI